MKYMGSKSRIAKHIVPIIQGYIDKNHINTYIEPFVGGANVIDKINCETRIGTDKNKYLIALLNHVKNGNSLYSSVPKELYDDARNAFNTGDSSRFDDWQLGNIGFLASYNGRWFDGGYAKPVYEKTGRGYRLRDYYREAADNLLEQSAKLKDIHFAHKDYAAYSSHDLQDAVTYVDPPYRGTEQYANSSRFNYEEFWDTMREWSKDSIVIISEQAAPKDFECIWEQEVSRSIKATGRKKSVERLFKYKG